jgi:hypothetical protein
MAKTTKKTAAKKRNAPDATGRNVRASQRRDDDLSARIDALDRRIQTLERALAGAGGAGA